MIEASLESGFAFWHVNSNFLNGVRRIYKLDLLLSPNGHRLCCNVQLKHLVKEVSPTHVWKLMIWPFDQNPTTLWSPLHLRVKYVEIKCLVFHVLQLLLMGFTPKKKLVFALAIFDEASTRSWLKIKLFFGFSYDYW